MRGVLTSEFDQWTIVILARQEGQTSESSQALCGHISLPLRLRQNLGVIRRTLLYFEKHGTVRKTAKNATNRHARKFPEKFERLIHQVVRNNPSAYLDEIAAKLHQRFGTRPSLAYIDKVLLRGDMKTKVAEFRDIRQDPVLRASCRSAIDAEDYRRLIFVDETHKSRRDQLRKRGRSKTGTQPMISQMYCREFASLNATLMAACNCDGFLISACQVFFGNIDRELFEYWIEHFLLQHLNPWPQKNSVVVLDNASQHHGGRLFELVESVGAKVLFLSPYSFDFNPIEKPFHQIKAFVRRMPKGVPLEVVVDAGLRTITKKQMRHYFNNCFISCPLVESDDELVILFFCITLFSLVKKKQ